MRVIAVLFLAFKRPETDKRRGRTEVKLIVHFWRRETRPEEQVWGSPPYSYQLLFFCPWARRIELQRGVVGSVYLFSGNALGFVGFFFPEIGDVRGEIETERRVSTRFWKKPEPSAKTSYLFLEVWRSLFSSLLSFLGQEELKIGKRGVRLAYLFGIALVFASVFLLWERRCTRGDRNREKSIRGFGRKSELSVCRTAGNCIFDSGASYYLKTTEAEWNRSFLSELCRIAASGRPRRQAVDQTDAVSIMIWTERNRKQRASEHETLSWEAKNVRDWGYFLLSRELWSVGGASLSL